MSHWQHTLPILGGRPMGWGVPTCDAPVRPSICLSVNPDLAAGQGRRTWSLSCLQCCYSALSGSTSACLVYHTSMTLYGAAGRGAKQTALHVAFSPWCTSTEGRHHAAGPYKTPRSSQPGITAGQVQQRPPPHPQRPPSSCRPRQQRPAQAWACSRRLPQRSR